MMQFWFNAVKRSIHIFKNISDKGIKVGYGCKTRSLLEGRTHYFHLLYYVSVILSYFFLWILRFTWKLQDTIGWKGTERAQILTTLLSCTDSTTFYFFLLVSFNTSSFIHSFLFPHSPQTLYYSSSTVLCLQFFKKETPFWYTYQSIWYKPWNLIQGCSHVQLFPGI